jgi:putative colanic acid biosynthesis acetyltransferase WcaF
MTPLDARKAGTAHGGPSFSLGNRALRAVWQITWLLLARWTPPPLHAWRRILLRTFGAEIGRDVRIYGATIVWLPAHLSIGNGAIVGPRARLYNQGHIAIANGAVISQGAHLCASSHDVSDRSFQLVVRPIRIEAGAWIAAEAFVGPGVTVGEGAVLGARGVALRDLEPWSIYSGNPAYLMKRRQFRDEAR